MKDYIALAPIKLSFGRIKVDKKLATRMGNKLRASGDGLYSIANEVELKGGVHFSADYIPKICDSLVMELLPAERSDKNAIKAPAKV